VSSQVFIVVLLYRSDFVRLSWGRKVKKNCSCYVYKCHANVVNNLSDLRSDARIWLDLFMEELK